MRFYQRLASRGQQRSIDPLSWDDYQQLVATAPLLTTSMSTLTEEQVATSANAAYRSNGPVFALTLARMQVFSQVMFQWTRFNAGVPGELFGSRDIGLLERPWAGGTTADLLARMELHNSLAGNAFVRRTSSTRLNVLRPDWVIIVLGSNEDADNPEQAGDVQVIGYIYAPPGGRQIPLMPHEVAHYAPIPDPEFNFLGISWVSTAIRDVRADDAQTEHKWQFLKNAATPNLAIKFDPRLKLAQVKEFKEFLEDEHRGYWNAWKTLYLGGGADPMVIGKDFRQLDFAATQGKGESRLAAASGVPPSWVGFSEGLQGSALNAGNFTAARRRFLDGTMAHLWANAAASLEVLLEPPGGANLWYSSSAAPVMREDAEDAAHIAQTQASTIGQLIRDGFTAASAIDAISNQDWNRLKHTGLTSVQLQPPSDGEEPQPEEETDGAPAGPATDGQNQPPAGGTQ